MKKKTQKEFENDVITMYGNRYDLSETVYNGNKNKIKIKCNLCGTTFSIRPNDLLSGHGCKCLKRGKYNGKYYKEKFQKIHSDKYDYSLLNDNKIYNKEDYIDIICKKHGVFRQKIKNHLDGKGCRVCANERSSSSRRLTQEEAVKKISVLCGKELKYELNEYKNDHTKIKFTCLKNEHVFYRNLNNLIRNQICPYCNGKEDYSTEWFMNKAREIHGDKYDYSKANYINTDKKVIVICHEKDKFGKEHGEFNVTPHAHIGSMKSGCPKCSKKHKYTTEEFIEEANFIHNNFYKYDKVKYKGAFKYVIITCPIHGDFKQKPNGHLSGQGCPHCKESHIENEIAIMLKENNIEFIRQYSQEWLKTKRTSKQTLDFFIPKLNIAIEVQGEQHFKPVKYWGGEENFKKVIERDIKKKQLCEKNNVYLLYYSECKNLPTEYIGVIITDKQELLTKILNYDQN